MTVTPETSQYDTPDGAVTDVHVPQKEKSNETNTADIADAHVTLPEGLTLNPSAAQGLEACTQAQFGKGTRNPVSCPASSKIGTVNIETDLPPGSLAGNVYLGKANGTSSITGPPYLIFIDTESVYDVSVRLEGQAVPNPTTGRLEVSFLGNPQLPFSDLTLTLNGGPRAPLRQPAGRAGRAHGIDVHRRTRRRELQALSRRLLTTSGCPSSIPFALTQIRHAREHYRRRLQPLHVQPHPRRRPAVPLAGLHDAPRGPARRDPLRHALRRTAGRGRDLHRGEPDRRRLGHGGSRLRTVPALRAGLPDGPLRQRPLRPLDPRLGRGGAVQPRHRHDPRDDQRQSRHRARDRQHPGRTAGRVPTIVGGVPVRLKTLKVEVNRPSFIFNPTNCCALATESTLTSTFNATQGLSSPFQVGNCSALAFKPSFKTATSAKTSKLSGASLQVSLTQPAHEANMKSVFVELPKQLPSRLTTLQKACPEATFAANPVNCRALGSEVGSATVVTPVLPGSLSGSAYLVSHGGEAFPDLDIVLEGDGVKVILTGNTKITKGITSSTFAAIPDVPVTSFVLNLPVGPHSALTAIGGLCLKPLLMPTTITAQSGAQVKQNTRISVSGCGVRILSHRVVKHKLIIKVRTLGAGLITFKGMGLPTVSRRVSKSATVTFKLPLTRRGLKALSKAHRKHRKLKISVRVAFTPKQKGQFGSAAATTVTFKR